MSAKVAVIGAGAWGTALAVVLARLGGDVSIAPRNPAFATALTADRENRRYLPGVGLPQNLEINDHQLDAVTGATMVVMAIPSHFAREAFAPVAAKLNPAQIIVSATKGIEQNSLLTMTQMLQQLAPANPAVALSGPGFAAEIARAKPAALVAASNFHDAARQVQESFSGPALRVYRSTDVTGVEIAGASKNVIAIAAGIADGLDLGSSARAALVTRGLAEIGRLGSALGARYQTIAGLAGLGDLVLTCTGDLSRNRGVGLRTGRGEKAQKILENATSSGEPVAEGIGNTHSLLALSERHQVEVPIIACVYRVLYEDQDPRAMATALMTRELKAEF
jgi:glycerol-3-phosphate dehydrogenase (NAD(P)+)